jgi:ABC-type multidrug transport system permease subunit
MGIDELFWKSWGELSALAVLLVGFIVAISLDSALFVYIVIFLSGIFAGRYYFLKIGRQPLFPFFLIIIGFLFGYVLGTFAASRKLVVFLFFAGWVVSHIAHKKGYLNK